MNPLGFDSGALTFDLNPEFYENASGGDPLSHFEQIYERALSAAANASATLAFATQAQQKLRSLGDDTDALVVAALEQDLDFRGSLIEIFGRPYDGQIGFGKAYPEGYLGPDTLLYAYLDRNDIADIIPGGVLSSNTDLITFDDNTVLKALTVTCEGTLLDHHQSDGTNKQWLSREHELVYTLRRSL